MASTMPARSSLSAAGDRDSGTTNHAAASAASPTGMFTRKIGRQCQPARFHCTSTPPMSKPATDAEPSTPPQTPKTFPRSWGGKVTWMIARICGTIRPAIAPSKNRAPISIPGLTATPHSADATVNPATPSRKIRLRPKMSPSRPPVINSAANPSTYPDTTHSNCAYVACRSLRMLGAATLTIVTSSRSITPATKMTTRAAHRRGSSAGGAVPCVRAWPGPGTSVRLCVSCVMACLPVPVSLTHLRGFVRQCNDGARPKDVSVDHEGWLAERFEEHRTHLKTVAYRMLGSLTEADDAVQEAWLRLSRSGANGVENLGGWLTTVVARVCLDMLRSRRSRQEQPLGVHLPDPIVRSADGSGPEHEALLADSVGLALLVVLDTLTPAERLAFVLHDMFDVPLDQIAAIVDRSPAATRQLASRARRRVKGAAAPDRDLTRQRQVVDAFFAAARRGDFDALVTVLDPEVVLRADGGVKRRAAAAGQALMFAQPSALVRPALVNGAAGVVITVAERPIAVMAFTVFNGKIAEIDSVIDPDRLDRLDLAAILPPPGS